MMKPKVSIIMSVFNGETHLQEAVESILNQSFTNFEFIIINDYSTDNSRNLIHSFEDERIIYLENEKNLGLAASLNKGIAIAKGKYIARMDDDDISFPNRIQKQVDFLDDNQEVGLLGTYAQLFGTKEGLRKHSADNDELKIRSLFSCQFCHPTVMLRKDVLDQSGLIYNESFTTAQDYEFWTRLIHKTNFATLKETHLKYRFHNKQISHTRRNIQIENTHKIYRTLLHELELEVNDKVLVLHQKLASFDFNYPNNEVLEIEDYFQKLMQANEKKQLFSTQKFGRFLAEYFYNILKKSSFGFIQKNKLYSKKFTNYFKPSLYFLKLNF